MGTDIVIVYCLFDKLLKGCGYKDDPRSKITNAEILTVAYMAMMDFRGNLKKAHAYALPLKIMGALDYSRFIRRVLNLQSFIDLCFGILGSLFQKLHSLAIYAIDSFPVELCQIQREKRCRLWQQPELKGYNASKSRFFYGLKVHLVATTNKEPVLCSISFGSEHDLVAGYDLLPLLPSGSVDIGDKAYVSNKLTQQLAEKEIIHMPIYRNNSKIEDREIYLKKYLRKSIETLFSTITERFGKVIKATSIAGFINKLKLHILAAQILCVIKSDEEKQRAIFDMVNSCEK